MKWHGKEPQAAEFECPHDVVGGGNFHNDSDTICDLCGAVVLWKLVTA